MPTAFRALLSVLMLVGFYVLAIALLVGCGAVAVLAFQHHSGAAAVKFGFLTVVVAVGIVMALVRVARSQRALRSTDADDVALAPEDAPELWDLVRELADVAGTRAPDTIVLAPVVNAAVSEESRLLGLVGGRRTLVLGVPLVQGLTVGRLRSVLGHEIGHYSNAHTRLSPIAYRGRAVVGETVAHLEGNLVGWLLRQYAKAYLVASAAVSRAQELEADRLSVRVAGRRTAQDALRELPVVDAAWSFYQERYLAPAWSRGYATTAEGFFGGFALLLAARADDLARLRGQEAPGGRSRWDSHPPIAQRVAAMDRLPDDATSDDDRPATALVPGFERAAAELAGRVVDFGDRERLGWDRLVPAFMAASDRADADAVYAAAARVAHRPSAGLGTLLDLVEGGHGDDLVRAVVSREALEQPDSLGAALRSLLALGVQEAAVRSGAAAWQGSWSAPAELVGRDAKGEVLDVERVVALAVDPATVDDARAALAAAGVDLAREARAAAAPAAAR
ncbi:M48 family metallopeptidase [Isoptericola sp. NPDC057653]|uniref:M48 family metallopeptidase n=1 Tax=Isoptericola sp. NPDC057653 TaxID=3346195 RepID=UPI0036C4C173